MALDAITELDILTAVHETTPLREILGGKAAAVTGTNVVSRKRTGRPAKYILTDEIRERLQTWDGTAESLNRLSVETEIPRNKLLEWRRELGLRNRAQPAYANGKSKDRQQQNPEQEQETPAQDSEPEPEPKPAPVALQARRQEQPTTPATPATPQTASSSEAAPPRIALDEWLMSGADGVWLSGMLAVQPLEGGQQFAILIAHPAVPRVPGPVPGHLVSYLVGALLRRSTITGIVYR